MLSISNNKLIIDIYCLGITGPIFNQTTNIIKTYFLRIFLMNLNHWLRKT